MKIIKKIFNFLYNILDKLLITPLSKIMYKLLRIGKKITLRFEGTFNSKQSIIALSLVISLLLFFIVDNKAINLVETESEILSDQKVNVIYNKEKYVVEGIPKKVDIILMGRRSDLYLAKQLGDHEVELNLSNYKAGIHKVKLKYNYSVASVNYKLDPGEITVKISEKVSNIKTLTYDLLNQDKLDSKLNISEITLDNNEVYVKASSEMLDKVATVKALIDISQIESSEAGTTKIENVPLVAYDENGKKLSKVEIVPKTVTAIVKIDSFYTDLPVKVVPKGKLENGFAIESATSSINTVRVYGDQETIKSLTFVPAEIDVTGLKENKTFNVTLSKPNGVRYMSEQTSSVDVKLGSEVTKEIAGISIETKNLGSDYVASTVNVEDTTSVVIAKGVQSVLDSITPESLSAYVDLSGYGPGTYSVPVEVTGENLNASYLPKSKNIQIKIANKS